MIAIAAVESNARASRWGALDWIGALVILLVSGLLGAVSGRDLNWDQLNYHIYVAHAFLHDRWLVDFNAASVQSYVNPLAHLPFYALATSALSSWAAAFCLGALGGLGLLGLYVTARLVLGEAYGWGLLASRTVAWFVVAMALTHPVTLAELGSSLAEIQAAVPFMLALCAFAIAANARRDSVRSVACALGFLLVGVAVALKLAFAVFVPGLFVVPLMVNPTWRARIEAFLLGALALTLGWMIAGGFWHVRLWVEFGNPFYPFFNNVFQSPDYPTLALVNDRFRQRTFVDLITFPWRMAGSARFVTTEQVAPDPRYALLIVLAAIALAMRSYRRVPLHLERRYWLSVVAAVWFVCWALYSGNGRYALPMHWVSGIVIVQCAIAALGASRIRVAAAVWLAVLVLIPFGTGPANQFARAPHAPRWHELSIPDTARVPDALYLTAGYFDRSSLSYLVPWMPSSARWINVNGYFNPVPGGNGGRRITRMIENHPGSLWLVAERFPYTGPASLDDVPSALWRMSINKNLEGFGVTLADTKACVPMKINKKSDPAAWRTFAWACPLSRTTPVDHRAEKRDVDKLFDELERREADLLYPRGEASYFRGTSYCRTYPPQEYYLCEDNGTVTAFRVDLHHELLRMRLP